MIDNSIAHDFNALCGIARCEFGLAEDAPVRARPPLLHPLVSGALRIVVSAGC